MTLRGNVLAIYPMGGCRVKSEPDRGSRTAAVFYEIEQAVEKDAGFVSSGAFCSEFRAFEVYAGFTRQWRNRRSTC